MRLVALSDCRSPSPFSLTPSSYRILLVEIEIALWLSLFLFGASAPYKYLSVVIPFFLALPALFPPRLPHVLLPVALAFTLVADFFFVLLSPPHPIVAISLFLFVQTVYFLFLRSRDSRARTARALIVRLLICLSAIPPILLFFGADPVPLLGAAYGVFLVANLKDALCSPYRSFAVGMLLFFLCDLSLGVSFLLARRALSASAAFSGYAAWAFYPPSQTLIALSVGADRYHLARV